jgi:UDP-3-O-[3-hydroxymyristoyl] glucosamine N-acyltransferase
MSAASCSNEAVTGVTRSHPGVCLDELAARLNGEGKDGEVTVAGDAACVVYQVAPLEQAGTGHIAFLANPRYRAGLKVTRASAVILAHPMLTALPAGVSALVTANPYLCYARVAALLNPRVRKTPGVHPSATVETGVVIPPSCHIGANVWIGAGSKLGERVEVHANAMIAENVEIGADSVIYPGVSIYAGCRVGERAIIHSGAVIGADGFGFAPDFPRQPDGEGMQGEDGLWVKIPQVGAVVIGHDVEIGANTSIDRGALADTIIGDGVKLDNQIQVGHNCVIGAHAVIAGCVGIAGSAQIGHHVALGGAAMVLGHLSIAPHTEISPGSMVMTSIKEPGKYTALFPLLRHEAWRKLAARLRSSCRRGLQAADTA